MLPKAVPKVSHNIPDLVSFCLPALGVVIDFTGRHFCAKGYCVNAVGLDEVMIMEYIKNQELEEKRQE